MSRRKSRVPNDWRDLIANPPVSSRATAALAAGLLACVAIEPLVARRVALVSALADGRPHTASEIHRRVAAVLGRRCWGRSPDQALWSDLRLLRQGGLRIGYCRRPRASGYFLYEPALAPANAPRPDRPSPSQIAEWRNWGSLRKLEAVFGAWEFALDLARAGARSRHPEWRSEQIEAEARRLSSGVESPQPHAA